MQTTIQIGDILYNLRTKKHISQSKLCRGLCSVSAFSRYERGERFPNWLLLNVFMQRLGVSASLITTTISVSEYTYLLWKRDVLQSLKCNDIALTKELLKSPTALSPSESYVLQKQFICSATACIFEKEKNYSKSIELLNDAICITIPDYGDKLNELLLSAEEMLMMIKLSELYIKNNQKDSAVNLLRNVIKYSENHYESVLLSTIYPKAVRILSHMLIEKECFAECEMLCCNAIEMLRISGNGFDLKELIACCLRCSPRGEFAVKYEKWLWALDKVNLEYDANSFDCSCIYPWEQELYLINEIVRDYRLTSAMSQEEMSFGLFSTETLSRAENGRHSLNTENYYAVRRKLSVEESYYNPLLNTNDYFTLTNMYKAYQALMAFDVIKAKKHLCEAIQRLENSGEIDYDYNRNIIEAVNIVVLFLEKKAASSEVVAACQKVLRCEYEDIFEQPFWNRYISKEKADFLNFIAIAIMKSEREKSVIIWEHILDKLEKSGVWLADRYSTAITAMGNLSTCYGILGRYENCVKICDRGIQLRLMTGHCSRIGHLIGDKAEALICLGENKETYRDSFRQAYYLSDLFNIKTSSTYYDRYYRENYDREIKWY